MAKGISFSGNMYGPKLLAQLVMVMGTPNVVWYARTKWSADALLAAYGERGA